MQAFPNPDKMMALDDFMQWYRSIIYLTCKGLTVVSLTSTLTVRVGHIPRELSKFIYLFLHEGGSVNGTVADTYARVSDTRGWT